MNTSTEQTLATIEAMRRQEHNEYFVTDYLYELPRIAATNSIDNHIDASCRVVMANWCTEVANYGNYKSDTVAIAMNCLDRFLTTFSGQEVLLDRHLYQLAVMTSLYSSAKIHEQEVMDTHLVSTLSKGVHTPAAIEVMESKMLMAIQWRVNPPTAMSFMRLISDLVLDTSLEFRQIILDRTQQQIEMTVGDYKFCTYNASSIAFASMLNSIKSTFEDDTLYNNVNITVGNILAVNESINDLRQLMYQHMEDNDINIGMIQSHVTKKRLSYYTDVNNGKENSKKLSPRTVRISVANTVN